MPERYTILFEGKDIPVLKVGDVEYLNMEAATEYLGVSRDTAFRKIREKGFKKRSFVGRSKYVLRSDLDLLRAEMWEEGKVVEPQKEEL